MNIYKLCIKLITLAFFRAIILNGLHLDGYTNKIFSVCGRMSLTELSRITATSHTAQYTT